MNKTFDSVREAFDYLVNKQWDSLALEQRKELRGAKKDFNHGSISERRMLNILNKIGSVTMKVEFKI